MLEELAKASIVELVPTLAWPWDGVGVEGGAANGTDTAGGVQAGVWARGQEAVGESRLYEGLHSRGFI